MPLPPPLLRSWQVFPQLRLYKPTVFRAHGYRDWQHGILRAPQVPAVHPRRVLEAQFAFHSYGIVEEDIECSALVFDSYVVGQFPSMCQSVGAQLMGPPEGDVL